MIRWFARVFLFAVWLGLGANVSLLAASYPLTDGTTADGEPISFTAQGVVLKKSDGTFAPRVGWTNFTQEALKEFAKQPKAKTFVEPYVEVDEPEEKKPALEIKPKAIKRLERPDAKAGMGSLFSSSLVIVLMLLVWAANIYAGFEIGVFRNYHPIMVAGIAAVAPLVGPVLFLCLPTRIQKSHDELAAESMAGHLVEGQPHAPFVVGHSGGAEQVAEAEAAAAAAAAQPKVTVYQRGQTTFNRRFFETKFSGFLKMVPGEAEKDMVMYIRSARGEHVGSRLTRILQNEIHLQVSKGEATSDVIIPFADIYEIQVRPKEAPATH